MTWEYHHNKEGGFIGSPDGQTQMCDFRDGMGAQYGRLISELLNEHALVKPDHVNQAVIDKIAGRASVGHKKYGVTMARSDLSELEWLELAQQEAMDLAVYLEKLIQIKKGASAGNDGIVRGL